MGFFKTKYKSVFLEYIVIRTDKYLKLTSKSVFKIKIFDTLSTYE